MATKKPKSIKVVRKRVPLPLPLKKKKKIKSKRDELNLVDAYIESISAINDLTQTFAVLPESSRRGIGGKRKLTHKEQQVLEIIQKEQRRADKLLQQIIQSR